MANLPMMPFWGNDFFGNSNVMPMMGEDIGAYVGLMWYAWQNDGKIPNQPEVLQCIARTRPTDWARVWAKIQPCWEETHDKKHLTNKRVLQELAKVRKMVADRSKAGRISGKRHGIKNLQTPVGTGVETPDRHELRHTGYDYDSENDSESEPSNALLWVKAIVEAYGETLQTAGAVVVADLTAKCAELQAAGKSEEKFKVLCDWCKNSKNEFRPKDAAAAADIRNWMKWQRMMEEEIEQVTNRKKHRMR